MNFYNKFQKSINVFCSNNTTTLFPIYKTIGFVNAESHFKTNFTFMKKCSTFVLVVFCCLQLNAQNYYQYSQPQDNNQNQNNQDNNQNQNSQDNNQNQNNQDYNQNNNQTQGSQVYKGYKAYQRAPKKDASDYKQLIKICPQWLLEGNVPIFYERKIGNNVSIEASVGLTFNNYLWDAFEQIGTYNGGAIPVSKRYYQPSFSLGGGIRYYPSGALDGFYIAPEIRYRNYQSQGLATTATTNPGTPSTNPTNYLQESLVFTDLKFVFGYVAYIDDVMPIEFFGGIGIRERNENRVYDATSTGNGGIGLQNYISSAPLLSLGIKIGVGVK